MVGGVIINIMEALEEAQLKVQQALYKLTADDLKKVCGGLPEIQDFDQKTKRQLIRLILNHLESGAVAESEDGGMATLLTLDDQLSEMLQDKKEKDYKEKMEELFKAHKQHLAELEEELKIKMAQLGDLTQKTEKKEAPPLKW